MTSISSAHNNKTSHLYIVYPSTRCYQGGCRFRYNSYFNVHHIDFFALLSFFIICSNFACSMNRMCYCCLFSFVFTHNFSGASLLRMKLLIRNQIDDWISMCIERKCKFPYRKTWPISSICHTIFLLLLLLLFASVLHIYIGELLILNSANPSGEPNFVCVCVYLMSILYSLYLNIWLCACTMKNVLFHNKCTHNLKRLNNNTKQEQGI